MQDLMIFGGLVLALVWIYRWGRSVNTKKHNLDANTPWTSPKDRDTHLSENQENKNSYIEFNESSTWQQKVKKYGLPPTNSINKEYEKIVRAERKTSGKFDHYRGEYKVNKGLFTATEAKFMKVLQTALSDDYLITAKVRVVDVIGVRRSNKDRKFYAFFNKVKAKHFDYVLCDKNNFSYVAAIELDDPSHQRADRVERDNFLNEICTHTGFPLIRIKSDYQYNTDEIRRFIYQEIGSVSSAHVNRTELN